MSLNDYSPWHGIQGQTMLWNHYKLTLKWHYMWVADLTSLLHEYNMTWLWTAHKLTMKQSRTIKWLQHVCEMIVHDYRLWHSNQGQLIPILWRLIMSFYGPIMSFYSSTMSFYSHFYNYFIVRYSHCKVIL